VVKVKICGFMNPADAKVACELGVDMIGVIVEIRGSNRSIAIEQARKILAAASKVDKVAVVMPNRLEDAAKVAHELRPDYLQVHSNFTAEQLEKLKELADAKIIGVVAVPQKIGDEGAILNRACEVSEAADYVLLDTKGPAGGGTGLTHDWNFSRKIRETLDKPVFLAGGLNPANVREAIKAVHPYGVDVASGVESSSGKKDPKLMRAFIEAAGGM